jgi:acyl-CoA dehydrogenase
MSLDFDSARLPNPNLTEEHLAWSAALRRFVDAEIMPHADAWDEAGAIPDGLWPKAASVGLLGLGYPEVFGGRPRTAGTPGSLMKSCPASGWVG